MIMTHGSHCCLQQVLQHGWDNSRYITISATRICPTASSCGCAKDCLQFIIMNTIPYVALQICAISEELLKTEYNALRIVYNRFGSAVSFKPTIATVLSPDVSCCLSDVHPFLSPCLVQKPMACVVASRLLYLICTIMCASLQVP